MKEARAGLIGTGYIGKAHAIAYVQAPMAFNLHDKLAREMVAEVDPALVVEHAQASGSNRSTGGWRVFMAGPAINVMDICPPNHLHKEMALKVIRRGKHVYSEKPLVLDVHDARGMADAVKRAGMKALVDFNYTKNPTAQLAKGIIARGEIGEVIHFYGTYNEDYMADPLSPIHWYCFKEIAGLEALGDLATHIVNMVQYLMGEIEQICGDLKIVASVRLAKAGSSEAVTVENEDQARAVVHFAGGAQSVVETSRVACGRKMGLPYVITDTKGAISFTQERVAKIELYLHDDPMNHQGLRTLLVGPTHPDYGVLCMGVGYGIGFNDQKTVEVHDLVDGIATGAPMQPDFEEGWEASRVLDAIVLSHQQGLWLNVSDVV